MKEKQSRADEWKKKKLGEEIELAYGKGLTEENRKEGTIAVFGSNGVVGFHNEPLVKGPGVIVGRKGSVGEIKYSKEDFWPIDTTYYVKLKSEGNITFWYYFLLNSKLNKLNSHSAVPGLNRDQVYQIIRLIPSQSEQSAIAKILSDLDSKIELNQQMDKNLESIGKAIFDHWFNSEDIPDNWETKPLDKIAEFLNGLPLQKYPAVDGEEYLPVIKIRELRNGISDQTDKACLDIPEDYLIEDGDVLFSWSGTLEVEIWTNGQGALNQHLFKVTSSEYPKWFYYFWTKYHLKRFRHIAKGKATTMGHIQRHNLSESNTIVPDKKSLEEMDKMMSPLIEKIILLRIESRRLAEIRDSLLPRLMSGKIRVPVEVNA